MQRSLIHRLFPSALSVALLLPAVARAQDLVWEYEGPRELDNAGRDLAAIDDLDGDGVADLIVGNPQGNSVASPAGPGFVEVRSGLSRGLIWRFEGQAHGDFFGIAVANAGDVDGDGTSDILVGAPIGGGQDGYAQVFSGRTGALIRTYTGSGGERFGRSVAGVGDLDGDGHADLLVGAYFANDWAGRAAVYSGADSSGSTVMFSIGGPVPNDQLGRSVAGVGDVDGRGRPDFAIGMPNADNAVSVGSGRGLVFAGEDFTLLHVLDSHVPEANLGYCVSGIGDIDQDGFADVVLAGAGAFSYAGAAVVYSGRTGAVLFEVSGESPGDLLGDESSVSGIGDANGDGIPDLAVGSPGADPSGSMDAGRLRIVSGASGVELYAIDGALPGGGLGFGVTGLGDIDGDGLSDFAVGSPFGDGPNGVSRSGLVQVFTSPQPGPAPDVHLSTIAASPTEVDALGTSIVTVLPRDSAGLPLGSGHRVSVYASAGALVGDVADPGDGTYTQVVQATIDGTPTVLVAAVNGVLLAGSATVTPAPAVTTAAGSETLVEGRQGSTTFEDTHASDQVFEYLSETESSGNPQRRVSHLEHRWNIPVGSVQNGIFFVQATRLPSTDGDDFAFEYSLDGNAFVRMFEFTAADSGRVYRTFALPPVSGPDVVVRVLDTDRTPGNVALDDIRIDHLGIADLDTPPSPPAAPTDLMATAASGSQIDLTWQDNATNESGYRIERADAVSGWFTLATLPADSTTHSDTGLPAGTWFSYRVVAVNGGGSSAYSNVASATTHIANGTVDDVATGEITVAGNVAGDFDRTWTKDGSSEAITEEETTGKPSERHSLLEHKWTMNVTGGSDVTFFVNAWHDSSGDGDDFVFAYSTDDSHYVDMVVVTKTADDGTYQEFALPAATQGQVFVRVRDTNRIPGSRELDMVLVDHMFIRSSN